MRTLATGLLGFTVLLASPARAQRERESLGVAAERDGGEKDLGDGIHFAGEARERIEMQDNTPLGANPERGDVTAYHRLLASADVRGGGLRGYLQIGSRLESGLNGPRVPVSTDRLDIQQAFVDLTLGAARRRIRIRGGRQEAAFEFVSSQDSPNVRRSWDGARATIFYEGWETDAFTLDRVRPKLGSFNDTSRRSDELDGLHLISPANAIGPFYLSGYYYHVRQRTVTILPAPAASRTSTFGGALDGQIGLLTLRFGGGRQTGSFGNRAVDAFSYEAVIGVSLQKAAWSPTIAVRTDGFSGGAPEPGRIRTWNPLFPNYAYSTEAALQSPSNLRKLGLVATASPDKRVELRYRAEALWRFSARDAFYGPSIFAPIPPDGSNSRWVGVQQQLYARWKPRNGVAITAAYVNFRPGAFIRRTGHTGQNFGLLSGEWMF